MGVFICLFITGVAALFTGVFNSGRYARWIGLAGLVAAFILLHVQLPAYFSSFSSMIAFDESAAVYTRIALITTFLIFLIGDFALSNHRSHESEIYALMLFSLCGGILLFSFTNLLMMFLGIEILSIPLYVLAGSRKNDLRSNEASLKYFLMGSFATGFLLMGIALIYGAVGTFDIFEIKTAVEAVGFSGMMGAGVVLLICAMAFKVSLAPFHMWSPDVYQGSPSIITLFMATVVKLCAYYALFRVLLVSFRDVLPQWINLIGILVIITLLIANVMGLAQSNAKRMLAYSSVSHAGYLALIFFGVNYSSNYTLAYYLMSYSLASVLVFTALIWVEKIKRETSFGAFSGLGKTAPLLAAGAAIGMFSMAGIPFTAGFIGKFMLFSQAMNGGLFVVVIAIVASAVSIAYYLRLSIMMFFPAKSSFQTAVKVPGSYQIVTLLCIVLILGMGVWPDLFRYLMSV